LINTCQQIGIHLSIDFFLPFELILIILLVALIGAIYVARQKGNNLFLKLAIQIKVKFYPIRFRSILFQYVEY